MSVAENKAAVRRYLERLDREPAATVDELTTSAFTAHFPGMPPMDRAGFKGFVAACYTAFPDLRHVLEDQVAEGDQVVCRLVLRGTHQGDFQGVAATGRPVTVPTISVFRVAEGRMAELWVAWDALGMLQQLGAVPIPG